MEPPTLIIATVLVVVILFAAWCSLMLASVGASNATSREKHPPAPRAPEAPRPAELGVPPSAQIPADLWIFSGVWKSSNGSIVHIVSGMRGYGTEAEVLGECLARCITAKPFLKTMQLLGTQCLCPATILQRTSRITG